MMLKIYDENNMLKKITLTRSTMAKEELKLPTIFYDGEEYVKVKEAAEQYRRCMTIRGLIYWKVVEFLQSEEGWSKQKAIEFIKEVVYQWGVYAVRKMKESGLEIRTVKDLVRNWIDTMEIPAIGYKELEASDEKAVIELDLCCHREMWEDLCIPREDWPSYCEIAESVDRALMDEFGMTMTWEKSIAKGKPKCKMVITKNKKCR
jgi:hypothetical protein